MKAIPEDRRFDFVEGEVLHFDKPLHWTSFRLVKILRGHIHRKLGVRNFKVGHAGTLDPLATGVMTVCTGRATKLIPMLQESDKEYVAAIRLGATTPSFDMETEVDAEYPFAHITREMTERVLASFVGEIDQVPPAYSAVNVNGVRAYKLARKGKKVEIAPKKVKIYSLRPIYEYKDGFDRVAELRLEIVCGSGTYIRSICRDLAEKLDVLAYMSALERTGCAGFSKDEAVSLEDFLADPLAHTVSDDEVLKRFFPFLDADEVMARKLKNGMTVACAADDGKFVVRHDGNVIGIGAAKDGYIKLETHL